MEKRGPEFCIRGWQFFGISVFLAAQKYGADIFFDRKNRGGFILLKKNGSSFYGKKVQADCLLCEKIDWYDWQRLKKRLKKRRGADFFWPNKTRGRDFFLPKKKRGRLLFDPKIFKNLGPVPNNFCSLPKHETSFFYNDKVVFVMERGGQRLISLYITGCVYW